MYAIEAKYVNKFHKFLQSHNFLSEAVIYQLVLCSLQNVK